MKELKEKENAYYVFKNYLLLGILILVTGGLAFIGRDISKYNIFVFGLIIIVHVMATKQKSMPKTKHVGPILLYVVKMLNFVYVLLLPNTLTALATTDISLAVLQLIGVVFLFVAAIKWKQIRPDMKAEAEDARREMYERKLFSRP